MRDADAVTARRERQLEPAVVAARTAQRRACRRAQLRRDFGTVHGCAAWVGERSAKGCSGLRARAKVGEQNPDQNCEQQREAKSHGVSSSPSRAGVEGCPENPGAFPRLFGLRTPPVSWLGGTTKRHGLPAPTPAPYGTGWNSGLRSITSPPYSRAAATAFHRLPVHGVCG